MTSTKPSDSVRRRRIRRRPGAAPGTLIVDPAAPKPRIQVIAFGPDGFEERELARLEEVSPYVGRRPVVWINADGLGDAEVVQALSDIFGIHRLALEDVVHTDQRPKVEEFDNHLFVVARMPQGQEGATEQVSMFVGSNYVLTFQETAGDCFDPIRERIRAARTRITGSGPDYLAYALLDALVDSFFAVVEPIGGRLDRLEELVLERPDRVTVEEIQNLKALLNGLRRVAIPNRDVTRALLREDTEFISSRTQTYVRDVNDHAIQIVDAIESYREACSDLMGVYLSSLSNKMNEIMKVLTIIATIFIPLSFVAGIYGMNFNAEESPWNMPELNWYLGYPFAIGLMLAIVLGFVVYFRRKNWL
jgi:magnesium transporter